VSLFLAHELVKYVAINQQLTIFQNCFGGVSRLYQGKS